MSNAQDADNGGRSIVTDRIVDYQPLIEALNNWQAAFELALDQAAAHLDPEQFPAEDLHASLAEMCDLLRAILSRNVFLHGTQS